MVRHGETEANAARIMAGSFDSPLTAKGIEQARAVQKIVKNLPVKPRRIIHSHLSRARDTALIINEVLNLALTEDSAFAELHAGDWERKPYELCHELLRGWVDPPGGERYRDFFERIKNAKIKTLSHPDHPPLVVSHGGVFRAFLRLYGIDCHGVQNCKLYEFQPHPENTAFPWVTYRYECSENANEPFRRIKVSFTAQDPASEIA